MSELWKTHPQPKTEFVLYISWLLKSERSALFGSSPLFRCFQQQIAVRTSFQSRDVALAFCLTFTAYFVGLEYRLGMLSLDISIG